MADPSQQLKKGFFPMQGQILRHSREKRGGPQEDMSSSRPQGAGAVPGHRHKAIPDTIRRGIEREGEDEDFMGLGAADWYQSGRYGDDGPEMRKDSDSDMMCTAPSSQVWRENLFPVLGRAAALVQCCRAPPILRRKS